MFVWPIGGFLLAIPTVAGIALGLVLPGWALVPLLMAGAGFAAWFGPQQIDVGFCGGLIFGGYLIALVAAGASALFRLAIALKRVHPLHRR